MEAGVSFVTIDLSNHSASGTWDTHGDNIPPYGGIWNGLRPLLPVFDHLITTLVSDLADRGLLDDTLVIAMGEFGRTPRMNPEGGRDHWGNTFSVAFAGGSIKTGQVVGKTNPRGEYPIDRPLTPEDVSATVFHHLGLDARKVSFPDQTGRPIYLVERGEPIRELVG